jgi:hypothetical protein
MNKVNIPVVILTVFLIIMVFLLIVGPHSLGCVYDHVILGRAACRS